MSRLISPSLIRRGHFIGFVSALAGLFSEQAFAKLESVSVNLFGKTASKGREQEQVKDLGTTAPPSGDERAIRLEDMTGRGALEG
jgi:hypothetical protein